MDQNWLSELQRTSATDEFQAPMACEVVAYYQDRGTVDLRACVKKAAPVASGGSYVAEGLYEAPLVYDVAVAWPGVGAFTIAWQLAAGDTGMLVPTAENFSLWREGNGVPADPGSAGRNGLYGAFLPGLPTRANVPPGAASTGVTMVSAKFMLTSAGGAAEKALALAEKVNTELGKIKDAFKTHTHMAGVALMAPPSGGAVTGYTGVAGTATAIDPYTNTDVDSTKVFTNG